ncbi:hypothetical protein [Novosphingobium pentaromativorans]|uniref:Integral membrane protein n=1 Tax=Novosphingobium pentaromativorans US6-1 TaxID=1088721 RepID=G6EGU2_9SPHN|nr:hypothetical protein [Novosphingobium pentaromativorans]AIT82060.1 hypothetical protein JI59_21185 [Novosphingobium pentaromativorans US6-1]EHJ59231.1 hypothetical protein NSU_3563 [Novosphingobium pentaromativorans US6-1]
MIKDVKLYTLGFLSVAVLILVGGMIPGNPMMIPASTSAADVAANYRMHSQSIIWFCILMSLSTLFWGLYVVVISVAMVRMAPRSLLLIFMHLTFGLVAVLSPFFGTVFFAAAASMPDLSPDVIKAVHEVGKFFLLGSIFTLFSSFPLATAIFRDHSADPILPKWFAWVNIVYAVIVQTNVFAPLFPFENPLGLDGFVGKLVPLIAVELFVVLTAIAMYRIKAQAWKEADTMSAIVQG